MKLQHVFNQTGISEVHKAGCSHLKKFMDRGFSFEAETKIEAVLFVYDCQIDEEIENDSFENEAYSETRETIAAGYIKCGSVKFAACVAIK